MAPASFFTAGNSPVAPVGAHPAAHDRQGQDARTANDPTPMWTRVQEIVRHDQEKQAFIEVCLDTHQFSGDILLNA